MTESVEAPERIWIESDCGYMYFYLEEELADAEPPITEYVRADKLEKLAAENERLQAEIEVWKVSFEQAASGHATYAERTEQLLAENEHLRAEVAEWKARADDLAAALNKCIKLAYIRDLDELPSAIIMTATKAVAKYDMLVDFSAALGD